MYPKEEFTIPLHLNDSFADYISTRQSRLLSISEKVQRLKDHIVLLTKPRFGVESLQEVYLVLAATMERSFQEHNRLKLKEIHKQTFTINLEEATNKELLTVIFSYFEYTERALNNIFFRLRPCQQDRNLPHFEQNQLEETRKNAHRLGNNCAKNRRGD